MRVYSERQYRTGKEHKCIDCGGRLPLYYICGRCNSTYCIPNCRDHVTKCKVAYIVGVEL